MSFFLNFIAGKKETNDFLNRIFALSPSQRNFSIQFGSVEKTNVRKDTFSFRKNNSRSSYSNKNNIFTKKLFSPLIVRSYCTVSSEKSLKVCEKMSKQVAFKRLPTDIVPKHYILELKPDLQKFTFSGKTSVKVQVSFIFF